NFFFIIAATYIILTIPTNEGSCKCQVAQSRHAMVFHHVEGFFNKTIATKKKIPIITGSPTRNLPITKHTVNSLIQPELFYFLTLVIINFMFHQTNPDITNTAINI